MVSGKMRVGHVKLGFPSPLNRQTCQWAARHDQNIDVFLTNEDWLKNGENRINGGVIMARNSKWSEDMCLGSR